MEEKAPPLETQKPRPTKPGTFVAHLAIFLAVLGILIPKPWHLLATVPAVILGVAYFVGHWRHASWTVDQAANVVEVDPR